MTYKLPDSLKVGDLLYSCCPFSDDDLEDDPKLPVARVSVYEVKNRIKDNLYLVERTSTASRLLCKMKTWSKCPGYLRRVANLNQEFEGDMYGELRATKKDALTQAKKFIEAEIEWYSELEQENWSRALKSVNSQLGRINQKEAENA